MSSRFCFGKKGWMTPNVVGPTQRLWCLTVDRQTFPLRLNVVGGQWHQVCDPVGTKGNGTAWPHWAIRKASATENQHVRPAALRVSRHATAKLLAAAAGRFHKKGEGTAWLAQGRRRRFLV